MRGRTPLIILAVLLLLRFLRGSLLLLGAALIGTFLAVFGTRIVKHKRTSPKVSGGPHGATPTKPYDPALVADAEYEEIE